MEEKNNQLWDDFYYKGEYTMRFPGEPEIKFFARMKKQKQLYGLTVLDFGCGVGRDLIFTLKLGLDAYGVETSRVAVEKANNNLFNQGYDAKVQLFDGEKIPFKYNFFDFIISFGVLDHMLFKDAKKIMIEFKRVLKEDGIILLIIHSFFDSHYAKGEKVEDHTFMINWGEVENGIVQHYFPKYEVKELIKDFKLERASLHEDKILDKELFYLKEKDSLWVLYLKK